MSEAYQVALDGIARLRKDFEDRFQRVEEVPDAIRLSSSRMAHWVENAKKHGAANALAGILLEAKMEIRRAVGER